VPREHHLNTSRQQQQKEIPMIAIHEPTQGQWSEMSVFIAELAIDTDHYSPEQTHYYLNNTPYAKWQLVECAALLIDSVVNQDGSAWTPSLLRRFTDKVSELDRAMGDMLRIVLADYPERLLLIAEAMKLHGDIKMIFTGAAILRSVVVALGDPDEVLDGLSEALIQSLI
jgi:hypothetical protein